MEKAIVTVMLTIAGVVAIGAVLNAMTPAIARTTNSITASADTVDGRISTQIEIVHVAGAASSTTVEAWVKNTGAVEVAPIDRVDVFFGPETAFVRIPYGTSGCSAPCWTETVENDTVWNPTATMLITLTLDVALVADTTYYIKIVTPNGISKARFFTV